MRLSRSVKKLKFRPEKIGKEDEDVNMNTFLIWKKIHSSVHNLLQLTRN